MKALKIIQRGRNCKIKINTTQAGRVDDRCEWIRLLFKYVSTIHKICE